MSFRRGVVLAFFISKGKVNTMVKTHFHSNPQQRWFKPSLSTGIKGAQYASLIGSRVAGARGMVAFGALGFLAGAVIGGVIEDTDVI